MKKFAIISLAVALFAGIILRGLFDVEQHLDAMLDSVAQQEAQAKIEEQELSPVLSAANVAMTRINSKGGTIDQIDAVIRKAGKTLDTVNAPCHVFKNGLMLGEDGKACGTLADVNQTLRTIRGTVGAIEAAANHEEKRITTLDAQEAQLTADAHGAIQSTDESVQELQRVLVAVRTRIDDPNITATMRNLQGMTGAGVGILNDGHRVTEKIADDFTAKKPWYQQIWPEAKDILKVIAGVKLAR